MSDITTTVLTDEERRQHDMVWAWVMFWYNVFGIPDHRRVWSIQTRRLSILFDSGLEEDR